MYFTKIRKIIGKRNVNEENKNHINRNYNSFYSVNFEVRKKNQVCKMLKKIALNRFCVKFLHRNKTRVKIGIAKLGVLHYLIYSEKKEL